MVSLPSIGVLQVGGLGSILDIKSDSISTSKLMEICCPNRVVNQQHFVERNLIVFCLRGMWHSKRGDFENHKKNLFGWIMLLGFSFHVQNCLSCCCNKFQEFQDVCSCVSTLWSAYASTCLSQQIGAKRFEAYQLMWKNEVHNGAGGTWITWHESIDRISAGNIRAF